MGRAVVALRSQEEVAAANPQPDPGFGPKREVFVMKKVQPKPRPPRAKKKNRSKPGTHALREIRYYQKTTHDLIRVGPFSKLFRHKVHDQDHQMRVSKDSVPVVQKASEAELVSVFEDCVLAALHARRQTIGPTDLELVLFIRKKQKAIR